MRKTISFGVMLAIALVGVPVSTFAAVKSAAPTKQQGGNITGVAKDAQTNPLPNYQVRVRNAMTGQLAGTTTSDAAGTFSFTGIAPGNYIVEIVDAAGKVVGLSPSLAVTAGSTVAVTVTAPAAGALAAATGGGFSLFGLGPVASVAVITAAGVATVVGVIAANGDASPSK